MNPLLAFVEHESEVLEPSRTKKTGESASGSPAGPGSVLNKNIDQLKALIGNHEERSHEECSTDGQDRICFRTKYNIGVEMNRNATRVIRVFILTDQYPSEPRSQRNGINNTSGIMRNETNTIIRPFKGVAEPERKLRYRILPDWQTSYLWYDPLWPKNPVDTYVVEEEEIEERYPNWYPFFSRWVDSREIGFDKEFGQSDSDAEAISDLAQIVAWETNGFLMGCWLALQEDVDAVSFEPSEKYDIRRGTMESELERFLRDKEAQLQFDD